ncbi:hypothetical protein C8Q72DRAFT_131660 [Fomitopsis betulina]|nr:hypothetical protein C8Q72DRAFT_131660 [Fomitopsis betulina]
MRSQPIASLFTPTTHPLRSVVPTCTCVVCLRAVDSCHVGRQSFQCPCANVLSIFNRSPQMLNMDHHSTEQDCAELTRSMPPIARLPNELLHTILLMWITDSWQLCSRMYTRHQGEALNAVRVCTYWRRLLLSYPALWTYIVLLPHSDPRKLETHISRSVNLPLYIKYFDIHPFATRIHTDKIADHGRLLEANAHRLREFDIHRLRAGHILPLLDTLQKGPTPLLDRLTVRSTSYWVDGVIGWPLSPLRILQLVLGGVHLNLPCDQTLRGREALVLEGNNLQTTGPRLLKALQELHTPNFLHLHTLSVHKSLRASSWPQTPIHMGSLEYFGFVKGIRFFFYRDTEVFFYRDTEVFFYRDTEVVNLESLQYITFPPSTSVAITLNDTKDFKSPLPSSSSVAVVASAQVEPCLELYSFFFFFESI